MDVFMGSQHCLNLLADGFSSGESPRWFEGLLWFSDPRGEAVHTVNLRGSVTTLPLTGCTPYGLGFRPDGSLLIASSGHRRVLRYDGDSVTNLVDLHATARDNLADMVVDQLGRAYISTQASEDGSLVMVDPDDGGARIVADGLDFPSGLAITPDQRGLIVAESAGRRLTAFSIEADGSLSGRRTFAAGLCGPPHGICMDAEGGVWVGLTVERQFQRIVAGGTVTNQIDMGERNAIACTLGGPTQRLLFLLSSIHSDPQLPTRTNRSRLDVITVDVPGGSLP